MIRPANLQQYRLLARYLTELPDAQFTATQRLLARTDLYYLLRYLLGRHDLEDPWLFERCREVEARPDGCLDLWPRGHYKSTIITFGKTLQDILASHGADPLPEWGGMEPTFGIFSHTRPIAKAFLRQLKQELETNRSLLELFPDVLYSRPDLSSPRWSEDAGLVVRRQSNPKEATVEAWGLIDGQPVGKHFNVLVYDDVVTQASVSNPDMIRKTTEAWELSLNLGDRAPRKRMAGTRYHFADTYRTVGERGAAAMRVHPGTDDGTLAGKPVFLSEAEWAQKVREMGSYAASSQLLLNPIADSRHTFPREKLRYFEEASNWRGMNRALLCDPADGRDPHNDYTAMAVVAKGPDRNLYVLDLLRDRLTLTQRTAAFLEMHRRWKPQVCGYEKYGKDSDLQHITDVQGRENYRFDIVELGGKLKKIDRVNRLIPIVEERRLYLPTACMRTLADGRTVDVTRILVEEELLAWPVPLHDDLADVLSRVFDVELAWPKGTGVDEGPRTDRYSRKSPRGSWMSA